MCLLEVDLARNNIQKLNSKIKQTSKGKKYIVSSEYIGLEGEQDSAYFGVDILGKGDDEADRRIVWLNDFSGTKKKISFWFTSPTNQVRLVYRINTETKRRSKSRFKLLPLDKVTFKQLDNDVENVNENVKNFFYQRPEELTAEQELILEKNIVWVFSSTRSGTTWLSRDLLSHETRFINEFNISQHLGISAGFMAGAFTKIEYQGIMPDYFFYFREKNTWRYYLRKLILNRIYSRIKETTKKIVIKEPGGFGFPIISECLPNSKIIILFRDGRDVIDSQVDARTYGHQPGGRLENAKVPPLSAKTRIDFIKAQANEWNKVVSSLLRTYDNHSENLRYKVKYEKLLNDTVHEMEKIYAFLGIKISLEQLTKLVNKSKFDNIPEKLKGKGKFYRSASPGQWKINFNVEEKELIEKKIGDTLKLLGY